MAHCFSATFENALLVRLREGDKGGLTAVYACCCPFDDFFLIGELCFIKEVSHKAWFSRSCSLYGLQH